MRRAIASVFGIGLVPRRLWDSDNGAGTFGAAVAWIAAAPWWGWEWWVVAGAALVATAAALWAAAPYAAGGDPGWVCIDETAGTLVAVVGLGGWPWLLAAAVARLADIFKVLPGVAVAERFPGAAGIVGDDLVAGLYGLGAGWLLAAVIG